MKKIIMATAAIAFFFSPWRPASGVTRDMSEAAPVSCDPNFFKMSASGMSCRPDGASFDILLFRPSATVSQNAEPVLYLLGGPGGLALPQKKRFAALAERSSRVILVPAVADGFLKLNCHRENTADAVWGIAAKAEDAVIYGRDDHAAKLDSCLVQVRENMTSGAFDRLGTATIASQLSRLRQDLAIPGWHLFAESYGARLALSLAGMDPSGTLSQALDSPETPWVDGFWHTGINFFNALKTLSGYCRDHFYCPAKRTRLERSLLQAIRVQDVASGAPVALRNIHTGHTDAYARPTREQLLISSFHALRVPDRAAILPYIAASPKNARERFGLLLDQLLYPGDGLNTGMHHLIRCRELPMAQWYRVLEADKLEHPDMAPLLSYLAWRQEYACEGLGIEPPDNFDMRELPKRSTLVLAGELDPVTPPHVIEAAFPATTGYVIRRYRALGHVTHVQNSCVFTDVMAFWNAPSAPPRRTACSSDDLALRFYSPVVVR